jgi:hypothetical protein
MLEIDAEREGARADLHAGGARGRRVLLGVAAADAAAATPAPAALRVEAAHPEADLGRQVDHVLGRQVDHVLDVAPAARAAAERLEQILINVVGHRPVGGRVTGLAPGAPGTPLAAPPSERRGLPLRSAKGFLQRGLEAIDLAALSPVLHLGAPEPNGQLVALGAQRVTLGDKRRECRVEDRADAEVVGHGRILILWLIRTTFLRAVGEPPGVSITYARRSAHDGR